MFCGKRDNNFFHFFEHKNLVKHCGYENKDIHEVNIKKSDKGTHFAYHDFKTDKFKFIWPSEFQTRMCFPDYAHHLEKTKQGEVCRVEVIQKKFFQDF